ncbi:MAG: flagellar assembly protein FliW [Vallitaleaceae bacterium]|jgi:flagellar assembly factor FliW|nr:flagellar assembly protein FliW [Vallitaleaceae bacterium]
MKVKTKHFGEVTIEDNKLVTFEEGIYGFEELRQYVILYDNEDNEMQAFCWLQSVDDSDICLPMVNPVSWFPTYSPEIDDKLILRIGKLEETDLSVFSVIVVPGKFEDITANLKAPIIVNNKTLKGIQVIVEGEEYQVRHNLYEQIQAAKKDGE